MSGVHTSMTNTRDTPVEALERALSVRVRRYTLRRGSGGAGEYRRRRRHRARARGARGPATLSLITERRTSRPWGVAGGGSRRGRRELAAPRGRRARARRAARQGDVELRPATSSASSPPAAAATGCHRDIDTDFGGTTSMRRLRRLLPWIGREADADLKAKEARAQAQRRDREGKARGVSGNRSRATRRGRRTRCRPLASCTPASTTRTGSSWHPSPDPVGVVCRSRPSPSGVRSPGAWQASRIPSRSRRWSRTVHRRRRP